jgi:RNA polymerase sigma factor (sigma-70 family)
MSQYGGEGFEDFVQAEFPRLWRLGRVMSGRDEDSWDLAQESLVRVGLRWSRMRRDGNPGAYARVCLTRLHLAKSRRTRREDLVDPSCLDGTVVPPATGADAVELTDQIARLLSQLPARQRAAVTLHYLEDLSVRDIAAALGCSEGTVKASWHAPGLLSGSTPAIRTR